MCIYKLLSHLCGSSAGSHKQSELQCQAANMHPKLLVPVELVLVMWRRIAEVWVGLQHLRVVKHSTQHPFDLLRSAVRAPLSCFNRGAQIEH